MPTRPTVLVVDDDEDFLRDLSSALSDGGYRVVNAADGQEALDVLERTRVDAIIIDLVLPSGPSGQQLIGAISKRNTLAKIIAVSEVAADTQLAIARYIGAHMAIRKFPPGPSGAFPRKDWTAFVEAVLNAERNLADASDAAS
jgi:CheY-like chemotaxis protein